MILSLCTGLKGTEKTQKNHLAVIKLHHLAKVQVKLTMQSIQK